MDYKLSYDNYRNTLKEILGRMNLEEFSFFLLSSKNGKLYVQSIDTLEKIRDLLKNDELFAEKEKIIFKEMQRTKDATEEE